ncbi:MAG: cupin domain-containing protein [Desulfocapsaceae bacterium]|nr:cupin domain-containing protein [Desulfocapsaceae bacterium]
MFKKSLSESPKRIRPGLVSHILLQSGDTSTDNLAIAWVTVEPGAAQQPHHHVAEQAYVVVSGQGRIKVGSDIADVKAGDLVYVPSNAEHVVENVGTERLAYISLAVPALDIEAMYDTGQLKR